VHWKDDGRRAFDRLQEVLDTQIHRQKN